jgi:hypothetical protein
VHAGPWEYLFAIGIGGYCGEKLVEYQEWQEDELRYLKRMKKERAKDLDMWNRPLRDMIDEEE